MLGAVLALERFVSTDPGIKAACPLPQFDVPCLLPPGQWDSVIKGEHNFTVAGQFGLGQKLFFILSSINTIYTETSITQN